MLDTFVGKAALAALLALGMFTTATRAQPIAARSPLQTVQVVVRPFTSPAYNLVNCSRKSPRLHPHLACPETVRLRHFLQARHLPPNSNALPFCRCQSAPRAVDVGLVLNNNGHIARVDVRWDFGSHRAVDTFVVVRRPAGLWLVDNEYCAGRPATSIYNGIAGEVPCYRV